MAMNGPKDIEAAETLGSIVDAAGPNADISEQILTELRRRADRAIRRRVPGTPGPRIPGDLSDDFIAELSGDDSPELAATARAALERRRR